ncbi:MAG: hypothetical protein HY210_07790 [Candidatus Omnitrophica bacterium]|nr:hypothetical protein [Candidatus Omnitrophota bacterium]
MKIIAKTLSMGELKEMAAATFEDKGVEMIVQDKELAAGRWEKSKKHKEEKRW